MAEYYSDKLDNIPDNLPFEKFVEDIIAPMIRDFAQESDNPIEKYCLISVYMQVAAEIIDANVIDYLNLDVVVSELDIRLVGWRDNCISAPIVVDMIIHYAEEKGHVGMFQLACDMIGNLKIKLDADAEAELESSRVDDDSSNIGNPADVSDMTDFTCADDDVDVNTMGVAHLSL